MCRFIAYRGEPILLHNVLFKPAHSIITQSFRALERPDPVNGDGFGFGWYDHDIRPVPGVFRSTRPAWSNRNILGVARMIRTRHFFAHVRGAYPGMGVGETNCHPFDHGTMLFMHNGIVDSFPQVRLQLRRILSEEAYLNIRGTTDSEHLFNLFLDRWILAGRPSDVAGLKSAFLAMVSMMQEILQEVGADGATNLNMVLTDGNCIIASRYTTCDEDPPTLYISTGADFVEEDGHYHLAPRDGAGSVFIASERFSGNGTWKAVPRNHLITVEPDLDVTIEPIPV